MALEALRREVLAKQLMTQRELDCVFANLTYKGPMIGEIKKKGDHIILPGIGRPTVRDYDPDTDIDLDNVATYKQDFYITQAKYVNQKVDDIDEAQSEMDVFNPAIREAKLELAETLDSYLAGFYTSAGSTVTNADTTATSIIGSLAEANQKLLEAKVRKNEEKFLVLSPAVYTKLILGKLVFSTSNEKTMDTGYIGNFIDFKVYVSNSIKKTGDVNHCMAFTRKAMAYAEQIPASKVKIYDIEKRFASAFKVLHLYGGDVIRPEELVVLNLTPGTESVV